MADTRRIRVTIGNAEYTLRGEESEAHLKSVARTVDNMMRSLASANPRLDDRRAAVLTALNLADKLAQLQEERDVLQAQYGELLELLDEQTRAPRESASRSSSGN